MIKLFQKFARCGAELHGLKRRSRKKAGRTAARARRAIGCPPVRVRDRTGQAGPWPGRTSRCVAARDEPPSCVPQGRVRGRTGLAAFLRAARAGAWPHRTSRLLACRKGGCVAARDEPPSCVPQGRGLRPVSWVGTRERAWKPTLFARLTAGGKLSVLRARCCPLLVCRLGQALVSTGHQRPCKLFA